MYELVLLLYITILFLYYGIDGKNVRKLSSEYPTTQGDITMSCFVRPVVQNQKNIQTQGEYSLLFFNNTFSHGITKLPKQGDFRSQEEFDSKVEAVSPPKKMILLGESILNKIPHTAEYARVDFINDDNDNPQIIELELIEPCLFLEHSMEAVKTFAGHIKSLLD